MQMLKHILKRPEFLCSLWIRHGLFIRSCLGKHTVIFVFILV